MHSLRARRQIETALHALRPELIYHRVEGYEISVKRSRRVDALARGRQTVLCTSTEVTVGGVTVTDYECTVPFWGRGGAVHEGLRLREGRENDGLRGVSSEAVL